MLGQNWQPLQRLLGGLSCLCDLYCTFEAGLVPSGAAERCIPLPVIRDHLLGQSDLAYDVEGESPCSLPQVAKIIEPPLVL